MSILELVLYKIIVIITIIYVFYLSFFRSGHRGSKAYSLWGGVVPSPSIGYDYL